MTERLPDWERRLADYIEAIDIASLGAAPCAQFAADCAQAITGVDFYESYRGRYKTAAGAARVLKRIGGGDLPLTFDLHFEQKPPAFAQRGDIVFNGESMGVCIGGVGLFIDGDAFVQLPRNLWVKAWAVG